MKKLRFRTLFPSIIFSLCILELSFGLLISFYVVWWFYLFCFFFLFNFKPISTNLLITLKVKGKVIFPYFLCASLYLIHHFLSSYILFDVSSEDAYNILWWTFFGVFLVLLIKGKVIDYHLFWKYTYLIVFFGTVLAAGFGIIKYFNILSGNMLPSYFYDGDLIIGSSLSSDYNLYSIGLLIGAVFSFQIRQYYKGRLYNVVYLGGLSVIYISSFLSGSRRGFLLTIVVMLLGLFYNKLIAGKWKRNIVIFAMFLVSSFFLLLAFWGNIIGFMESSGLIDASIARIFTIKDEFSGENNRTIRYLWAYDKFSASSLKDIIVGGGFGYLTEMGSAFGDSIEDHPHNFIFSTLLYGGILSLFLIILLLYNMLSNTFGNDRPLFFVIVILIFFSLSSANSLFSFRIFPTIVFLSSLQFVALRRGPEFCKGVK